MHLLHYDSFKLSTTVYWVFFRHIKFSHFPSMGSDDPLPPRRRKCEFKGRVHVFFIRKLDVPPLGESNLMGPKKSVEVKFFMVAFFGCTLRYR